MCSSDLSGLTSNLSDLEDGGKITVIKTYELRSSREKLAQKNGLPGDEILVSHFNLQI